MVFSLPKKTLGHYFCFVFGVCVGKISNSIILICVTRTQVRENRMVGRESVFLG